MSTPSPASAEGAEHEPDLNDNPTGEGERESQGEGVRFGGLTPREAALRSVQARRERQARDADRPATTAERIRQAFDGLSQRDWDDAVKQALKSPSGMQALTRLLTVAGVGADDEGGEGESLTPEERAAILARFTRVGGSADQAAPSSTTSQGDAQGEVG